MRGLSRKWVWRCAAERTPAASRSEHVLQERGEGFRGEGEGFAQGGEVSPVAWLAGGNVEDQAGN